MAIKFGRHDYTSVDVIIKDRFIKICTMAKDNSAETHTRADEPEQRMERKYV